MEGHAFDKLNGMGVLIVDNIERYRRVFSYALSGEGCWVETARDIRAADEQLRVKTFDVLVIDVAHDEKSSLEFLNGVVEACSSMGIIVVSDTISYETMSELYELGISCILPKDVGLRTLCHHVVEEARAMKRLEEACIQLVHGPSTAKEVIRTGFLLGSEPFKSN